MEALQIMPIVEYLDPARDYKFHQFELGSRLVPDGWIRVPSGAEKATLCGRYLIFWKNNIESFSKLDGDTDWTSGGDNMPFDEYMLVQSDVSVVWQRYQHSAVASLNDIAKTAEIHREHNLSNELNDLCAEFGCPPGMDRMAWLRGQLRIAKTVRILGAELTSQCNW